MDRKSIIGFVLIFIIILTMPYYFKIISKNPPETTSEKVVEQTPTLNTGETTPAKLSESNLQSNWQHLNSQGQQKPDTLTIENDLYRLKISSRGGGTITSVILKNYNKIIGRDTSLVEMIPSFEAKRLFIKYLKSNGDSAIIDQNFQIVTEHQATGKNYYRISDGDSLTIRFQLTSDNNPIISRTFVFYGDKYFINSFNDLSGILNEMASDKYELVWEGGIAYTEAMIKEDVSYSRASACVGDEIENLDVKQGKTAMAGLAGATYWTAIKTKYFVVALIPHQPAEGYLLTASGIPSQGKDFQKKFNMYMTLSASSEKAVKIYLGPLDYNIIKGIAPKIERLMNFGASLIRPISIGIFWLFTKMHLLIPNYGWVLIIFSILLKIVLTPLTNSSTRSMKEMQNIQPQLNAIQEKYASDPQRLNNERLKLMREHNVNPMGGCLPLLLQMPILWALFIVFRTTIELRQAPFIFWITDLSAPDTIFTLPFPIPIYGSQVNVLPFIMAISQLVQQKISGASGNQQQKVMTYFMTIFFFFLFNQFPSGLNLYYTLYNILSIVQQKYFPPKPKPKKVRKTTSQTLRQYQTKIRRR
ncbi:MAG TPA: membrane protein insertase YidC [Candidatus Marinimicrobia bacterium]|nr:membrane protein insertase YidC [Candidatus Neomarinimicrobiota bacterium]HRS50848.1 membrane protein insertase YidC [Candidatus Neomarinimicrobiota bacterium]HRU91810.1 membrane protein insertase YidC [Candidatus Neomarinimicrobiota bacterium]